MLTWSSTLCLGFWFPFRRYQHMQHNVEQHRCNFWINNQPLMASQEVNSLISARLQTELSADTEPDARLFSPPPAWRCHRQWRRASSLPACTNYPEAGWHCKEIPAPTSVSNDSWLCQTIFTLVGAPFDQIISRGASFHVIRLCAVWAPRCIVPACVPISKLKRDKMSSDLSQSSPWFII